jgi:hypothetical protein
MSNAPTNREQNQKIDQTPTHQDPGTAKATDFLVRKAEDLASVPGHGQHGRTAAEEKTLLNEADDLGKSKFRPIPDRLSAKTNK